MHIKDFKHWTEWVNIQDQKSDVITAPMVADIIPIIQTLAQYVDRHNDLTNHNFLNWFDEHDFGYLIDREYELVNSKGKITKRIAKAIKNKTGIKMDGDTLSLVGNVINKHQKNRRSFSLHLSHDMDTNGDYGDRYSCFMPDGCNHHHWLGMNDDIDFAVLLVKLWKGDEYQPYARSWVYIPDHESLVLFNGYGIKSKPLANIFIRTLPDEHEYTVQNETISFNTSVWFNGDFAVVSARDHKYSRMFASVDIPDVVQCWECGDRLDEYGTYYADERVYCESCYDDLYTYCAHCDEPVYRDDTIDICNGYYCEHCAHELSTECDHCADRVLTEDMIHVKTGNGEHKLHCDYCADRVGEDCIECEQPTHYDYMRDGVCFDCREDNVCSLCNKLVNNAYMNIVDNVPLCDRCLDVLREIDCECEACAAARAHATGLDVIAASYHIRQDNQVHYVSNSKYHLEYFINYRLKQYGAGICDRHLHMLNYIKQELTIEELTIGKIV